FPSMMIPTWRGRFRASTWFMDRGAGRAPPVAQPSTHGGGGAQQGTESRAEGVVRGKSGRRSGVVGSRPVALSGMVSLPPWIQLGLARIRAHAAPRRAVLIGASALALVLRCATPAPPDRSVEGVAA